jgi:hypothetical protein
MKKTIMIFTSPDDGGGAGGSAGAGSGAGGSGGGEAGGGDESGKGFNPFAVSPSPAGESSEGNEGAAGAAAKEAAGGASQQQAGQQTQQGQQQAGQQGQQQAGQAGQAGQAAGTPPSAMSTEEAVKVALATYDELQKRQQGQGQQQAGQRGQGQVGQQGQAQQLSKEQLDQKFQVVYPTQEQLETIFKGGAEGVGALTNLLHSTVRMATAINAHFVKEMVDAKLGALQQSVAPAQQMAEQQVMKQAQDDFYKTNADLKPYEPLLIKIYENLKAQGFSAPRDQVFAKIADEARTTLKAMGITPAAGGNGSQQSTNAGGQGQTTHKMTTLASGAGAGNAGGGSAPAKSTAERLFGGG